METVRVMLAEVDINGQPRKIRLTIVDTETSVCSSHEMPIELFIKTATHLSIFAMRDVLAAMDFGNDG